MKTRILFLSTVVLSLTMAVLSRGAEPLATGSPPPLVAHRELEKRLGDPALRLIDARPRADYDGGHIPGAVWLDPKVFEPLTRGEAATDRAAWGRVLAPLGVGPETEILVYDDDRYHLPAGRVWFWLSYAADARAVGLIDGRFSSWERAGRPVSTGETRVEAQRRGHVPTRVCWPHDRMSRRPPNCEVSNSSMRVPKTSISARGSARSRRSRCPAAGPDIFRQPSCSRPRRWCARTAHSWTPRPCAAPEPSRYRDRPADHRLFQGGRPLERNRLRAPQAGTSGAALRLRPQRMGVGPDTPSRDHVGTIWGELTRRSVHPRDRFLVGINCGTLRHFRLSERKYDD